MQEFENFRALVFHVQDLLTSESNQLFFLGI
jgi:hypothetical protein